MSASIDSSCSTSLSLLKRAGQLDAQAWERLLHIYSPLVYRWCRRAGLVEGDVADVMQNVFLAVSQGILRFYTAGPNGKFRGWLWGITRNKLADHSRQQSRAPSAWGGEESQQFLNQHSETPPEDDDPREHEIVVGQILYRAITLLKPEFTDSTWQAFWRTVVEGEPSADVARDLNMTSGAVRQARYRVLRRFRLEMEDLLD